MSNGLIALLLALKIITLQIAVQDMSIQAGVDPALAACIITTESNWDTNLVSKDFDTGLFQIIPPTAEWVAEQMVLAKYDLLDPVTNIRMGLWILKRWPGWFHTIQLCD
jgi:soluble lytic murein transglycosylase-like protein